MTIVASEINEIRICLNSNDINRTLGMRAIATDGERLGSVEFSPYFERGFDSSNADTLAITQAHNRSPPPLAQLPITFGD